MNWGETGMGLGELGWKWDGTGIVPEWNWDELGWDWDELGWKWDENGTELG